MKKCIIILLFYTSFNLISQPDSRFRAFDWTLFKGSGSITSITEGYNYIYVGTKLGGLKRFNLFGNKFDDPITMAQGLKENQINATHFDLETGIIWIATSSYLQYSYSREGDWYSILLEDIGFLKYDKIEKMGSSSDFLWLKAKSTYFKLDHSSGVLIGIYPIPDELNINWSSGKYIENQKFSEIFLNFTFMDGYLFNGGELIDNLGRRIKIETAYIGNHGNIFFGTNNGIFFHATNTMQVFSSFIPDINNIDVNSLFNDGDKLWIGSSDYISSKGICSYDLQNNETFCFEFESSINMTPTSVSSIIISNNELWVGGNSIILYHDIKKNYWRSFGQERGVPTGIIFDMYVDSSYIWIASSSGINSIDLESKRVSEYGIESLFKNIPVYDLEGVDNDIWIGSYSGVYILSLDNPQIRHANEIGKKDFPEIMKKITAIKSYDREVYIVGDLGITIFDLDNHIWEFLFPSSYYGNKIIYSLAINKKYIFLGSNNGLIRIHKKTGFIREYDFEFIGEVKDLSVDRNHLWIGSTEGLIRFKWKRDI